jgi:hypothetical protein|tara:strand:+ start:3429 stop:3815 length:387 start_codon:yes stop_codon:yes gene_type:complete
MSIYNECKIVINLNQLVKDRPCGVDLDDEHVDNIASDLRKRMTFDSLFGQVDQAIWDYAADCGIDLSESEECQSFGFTIPEYGSTAGDEPAATFEKERKAREKEFKKNFEMVDLVSSSWTIQVPKRKK